MARTSAGGIQEIEIQNSTHTYAADAGGTDDYAIALTPAVAAYVTGQRFAFKANTANTTGATLNVNGLGAKTILKHSSAALANNDIKAGSIVEVYYDGTNFQMVSMLSNAPAGGGDMVAATYDALGIASQVAGVAYANSFTKSQAMMPDSDAITLAARRNGAAQTANIVEVQTEANVKLASFDKAGKLQTPEVTIDASGNLNFGAVTVIDDNAGTTTLQNIDAIDATTETTLEAALDFAPVAHSHEGTAILSTGEVGGTKYLREDGDGTCSWQTVAGGGNVSKVGTPVDNQIGVWTGDGTIEGDTGLTYSGSVLAVTGGITTSVAGTPAQFTRTSDIAASQALIVEGDRATPANNDEVYASFKLSDSAGNQDEMARISVVASDVTSTSEDSYVKIATVVAGTLSSRIQIAGTNLSPFANDGLTLGNTTNQWSDLYLAEGGVINWDNGDATLTQTGNVLKLAGASLETDSPIELGHASDTTISRVSAGVIAVEGVTVPTISSTSTLTNKRRTRRLSTTNAPGATPTTNTDNVDVMNFTGLGTAITSMTTNLSGTPVDGDLLEFRFTDDGTARAITWGASFAATTVALPTTTVISTMLRVGFEYSGSTWKCIATA